MIHGFGDKAWITSDKKCTISKNGSFIQFDFEESGLRKSIRIPSRYIEKINELKNHRDSFETFVELDEPANQTTLADENKTREEDFKRRLRGK